MKRVQINLSSSQIEQLLVINNLPADFKEKIIIAKQQQSCDIFTNEEELEKILDQLPPPYLANSDELALRNLLTDTLQTLN